jgi:hypothetical protein
MMLTVDGVYQGPRGPDEDRRGGFDRGGWVARHFDEGTGQFVTSVFERADALRQTHDLTLVESRSTPSGVTLQTYRPAGRATFGNAG